MDNVSGINTAKAVKSMISGLASMTVFTFFWFGVAFYGAINNPYRWLLLPFVLLCILFIFYIIKLLALNKTIPLITENSKTDAEKKKDKLFMMAVAAEGVGIFIAINVVANLHHPELEVPAMALVVGLHFFPMAKVFDRKMDYYIGAWTVLVAVIAIAFKINNTFSQATMLLFTGVGLALATSIYGINMLSSSKKLLANNL